LRDKNKVLKLVELVDPIVRTIDVIAGECVAMRVCTMQLFLLLFSEKKEKKLTPTAKQQMISNDKCVQSK